MYLNFQLPEYFEQSCVVPCFDIGSVTFQLTSPTLRRVSLEIASERFPYIVLK